ncbi:ribonuclease H-like domain-containing protein [Tanacetum coccineum]
MHHVLGSSASPAMLYESVDDIILTASSSALLQQIISSIHTEFSMTDLGPLTYFLGISATCTTSGLTPGDSEKKLGPEGTHVSDSTLMSSDMSVVSWILVLSCISPLLPLLLSLQLIQMLTSAIYMSANPVQHQRPKHIEIDIHFVRDKVAAGHVRVLHVPSQFQFADIFTKGLPYPLFTDFRFSLSVRKPPAPTAGAYYITT